MSPVERVFNLDILYQLARHRRTNGYTFGDALADTLVHELMDTIKEIKKTCIETEISINDWNRFREQFTQYFDTVTEMLKDETL